MRDGLTQDVSQRVNASGSRSIRSIGAISKCKALLNFEWVFSKVVVKDIGGTEGTLEIAEKLLAEKRGLARSLPAKWALMPADRTLFPILSTSPFLTFVLTDSILHKEVRELNESAFQRILPAPWTSVKYIKIDLNCASKVV